MPEAQFNFPPVIPTEPIKVMEGLHQPPSEVLNKEYGFSYIPPQGSRIAFQCVVQGENVFGNKVTYTVSKWETTDERSGIIMVDSSDGRRGLVPTGESLTLFLQKHKLTADLQPIEEAPHQS